ERAQRDAQVERDDVLKPGHHAECVVAETQDRVLDQQSDAVEQKEDHAFFRGTCSLAMPEAPVPIAEESDDRRYYGRDSHRDQRAKPERPVQRYEHEIGDADPDPANDQELGALVDDMAETLVKVSGVPDQR